jgi:RNA polymerase sigma-70 factor (ECF subfamily)
VSESPEETQAGALDIGPEFHRRMLNGDVTAPAEIADAFLPPLVTYMKTRYSWVDDPHLPQAAAVDAVLSYLQRPQQYNPEKRSLASYLRMSANGDLKNELTSRTRERQTQGGGRVVELDAPGAEYRVEDNTGLSVEEQVEILVSPVWPRVNELVTDPVDRQIVRLMMENVRETTAFAQVLGITHLSNDEQAQEVKRHKDRLKKHLQRHLRLEETDDD